MKKIKLSPLQTLLKNTVEIPGSKSYTNRSLLLATFVTNPVKILNPLMSDDTRAMISCLRELGIEIREENNSIIVVGDFTKIKKQKYSLNASLSGTTIRFITALATLIPGEKIIFGEEGLNKRPIKDLVDVLRQLGAEITYMEKEGFAPLRITSKKLKAGAVKMNGSVSSQFLSSVLMIAPLVGKVTIEIIGELISKPYVVMTIDTLSKFGVAVENNNYERFTLLSGQKYHREEYVVEGDVSSASYFFAIAALTKSKLTLINMNPNSVQADMNFLRILEQMGNAVVYGKNEITFTGKGIKAKVIDMESCPDQAQTMAVLAAFANGVTTISGVQSLRVKETERVVAVQNELKKMGIKTEATHDTLTIYGGNPKAAAIDTYGDHRMAMAFAVAGVKLSGIVINNPEVVTKTFPTFWQKLKEIGMTFKEYEA